MDANGAFIEVKFDSISPMAPSNASHIVGFLRGGGNWGTLRIPREDWETLGKIREPPPLGPPLNNPKNISTNNWKIPYYSTKNGSHLPELKGQKILK